MKTISLHFKQLTVAFCLLSWATFLYAEETPRFSRGDLVTLNSTILTDFQSFVWALSGQSGVLLNQQTDGSELFQHPFWFSKTAEASAARRQVRVESGIQDYSIIANNPIVAFGHGALGSPLIVNRKYEFGVYCGSTNDASVIPPTVRIVAYLKSAFVNNTAPVSPVAIVNTLLPISPQDTSSQTVKDAWNDFALDNYAIAIQDVPGLKCRLRLKINERGQTADASANWGVLYSGSFVLEMIATDDSYYYVVEGSCEALPIAPATTPVPFFQELNSETQELSPCFAPLYAAEFDKEPIVGTEPVSTPWINLPHFEGEPAPGVYAGKSPEELLATKAVIPTPANLPAPANCLALDDSSSPELREHPFLDDLVDQLAIADNATGEGQIHNALSITNYILNEIELSEPVSAVSQTSPPPTSLNFDAVTRAAFGVAVEGEGSPIEQCALLVYMLRKAGIPALYVQPESDSLKLLDFYVNRLLRTQLIGGVNYLGGLTDTNLEQTTTSGNPNQKRVPRLVSANYPWVLAYVNGGWTPLFPWMADVNVHEGYELNDILFTAGTTNNSREWIKKYVNADPSVMKPEGVDKDYVNTPAVLFPKFINKQLQASGRNATIDDIGVRFETRKHYFTRLEDLPRPFAFGENSHPVAFRTISERYPDTGGVPSKAWATFSAAIKQRGNTGVAESEVFSLGTTKVVDLNNRRLVVRQTRNDTEETQTQALRSAEILSTDVSPTIENESAQELPLADEGTPEDEVVGDEFANAVDPQPLDATAEIAQEEPTDPQEDENGSDNNEILELTPEVLTRSRGSFAALAQAATPTAIGFGTRWKNPSVTVGGNVQPAGNSESYRIRAIKIRNNLGYNIKVTNVAFASPANQIHQLNWGALPFAAGGKKFPFTLKNGKSTTIKLLYIPIATSPQKKRVELYFEYTSASHGNGNVHVRPVQGFCVPRPILKFSPTLVYHAEEGGVGETIPGAVLNEGPAPATFTGVSSNSTAFSASLLGTTAGSGGRVNLNLTGVPLGLASGSVTLLFNVTYMKANGVAATGVYPLAFNVLISQALHTMQVRLSPFRPDTTGLSDFSDKSFNGIMSRQQKDLPLYTGTTPEPWESFVAVMNMSIPIAPWYDTSSGNSTKHGEYAFEKGDLVGLCMDLNRVSQSMLDLHGIDYWTAQSKPAGIAPALRDEIGVYLLGLSYFRDCDEFDKTNQQLHKTTPWNQIALGASRFDAARTPVADGVGPLPNGNIYNIKPIVDMLHFPGVMNQSGTTRQDAGQTFEGATSDYFELRAVNDSAYEHQTINDYLKQTDSISTVRLLQIAADSVGIEEINGSNYLASQSWIEPKSASLWKDIKEFFDHAGNELRPFAHAYVTKDSVQGCWVPPEGTTPGKFSYKGMGALLFSQGSASSIITGNQIVNGGAGGNVSQYMFTPTTNITNLSFDDNHYTLNLQTTSASSYAAPHINSAYQLSFSNITPTTQFQTTSFQNDWSSDWASNHGITNSSSFTYNQAVIDTITHGSLGRSSWVGDVFKTAADPVDIVTGAFYVDQVDLALNGPFPLSIRRNYSSRNKDDNYFGYGWKLSMIPFLVLEKPDQSSDTVGDIRAAEMDGSVIIYTHAGGTGEVWTPRPEKNPNLNNLNGGSNSGSGNMFEAKIVLKNPGEPDAIYELQSPDGSFRTFQRKTYHVGTYDVDRPFLQNWTDKNGNTLTFDYFDRVTDEDKPYYGQLRRIRASNGDLIGFTYDSNLHIKQAYAGDGRRVIYTYDSFGQLTKVRLPDGSETTYGYLTDYSGSEPTPSYLLEEETKPGNRVLFNTYDDLRRVKTQSANVDADNLSSLVLNATFDYDNNDVLPPVGTTPPPNLVISGTTTVTDVNGKPWIYTYADSQITGIKDPKLQTITRTWYPSTGTIPAGGYARALWTEADKRGLVTTYTYDSYGNLHTTKIQGDLTGNGTNTESMTTTTDYDYRHRIQSISNDASSVKWSFQYHEDSEVISPDSDAYVYLPWKVRKKVGETTVETTQYDYTHIGSVTDPVFARGLLQTETRASEWAEASTTSYEYFANGFAKKKTETTGTSDPAVVTNFEANLRGEKTRETDSLGRYIDYAYDDMGRPIWTETHGEGGGLIGWNYTYYNGNGDVEWQDGPRYYPEDYIQTRYDGAGRKAEETRWRSEANPDGTGVKEAARTGIYATTFYHHDNVGNLSWIVDPMGNKTTMDYDDVGQMRFRTDSETHQAEEFNYEPGGEVSYHKDKIGGETMITFTSLGKISSRANPDGVVQTWLYQLDGRLAREPRDKDTYWTYAYEDQNRKTIRTLHGRDGTALGTESLTNDRRGNVSEQVDLDGFVWGSVYDGLNRLKTFTGPAATTNSARQTTTYSYDASGKTKTTTNAANEQTVTTTDKLGRITSESVGGLLTSYTYSPDHHSVTVTAGSGSETAVTTTYTDNAEKPVIQTVAAGSTILDYDRNENLVSEKTPRSFITGYEYDGLNRQRKIKQPDLTEIILGYDKESHLTSRSMPGELVWSADYNSKGQKKFEQLAGSTGVTRRFDYDYHTGGADIGRLNTVTDPRGIVQTMGYDGFGRVETVTAAGSADSGSQTFGYNNRGTVQSVAFSSTQSPSSTVVRGIDGYSQITSETVTLGGSTVADIVQKWNSAGRRYSLTGPGAYGFHYRADGLMDASSIGTTSFSFGYDAAGLLKTSSGLGVTRTVTGRDAGGRLLTQDTAVGSTVLSENTPRYSDGNTSGYSATRSGAGNISRTYQYNNRGQLTDETLATGTGPVMIYSFDPEGRGIRIGAKADGVDFRTATTVNGFGRIEDETSLTGTRDVTVTGTALGAKAVTLSLDGGATATPPFAGWQGDGSWSFTLSAVQPGLHSLEAKATHPSGYIASDTSSFNVKGVSEAVHTTYDLAGNAIAITGQSNRVLTWDWLGRLTKITQDEANHQGFVWTAAYDGLGRRLKTTYQKVESALPTGAVTTTSSVYDPEVEFLELAATINGTTALKLYGPDLDGSYGGLQGIGGLQAVLIGTTATPFINDAFGNAIGTKTAAGVVWKNATVGGYGALPGSFTTAAVDAASLANATLWRGKRVDETGLYWLGARYYMPDGGRFISADPAGNASSISLYDFANGDPINFADPDGRFAVGVVKGFTLGTLAQQENGLGHTSVAMSIGAAVGQIGSYLTPGYGEFAIARDVVGSSLHASYVATDIYQNGFTTAKALDLGLSTAGAVGGGSVLATTFRSSTQIERAVVNPIIIAPRATTTTLTSSANVEAQFTKSTLRIGQQMHSAYKADIVDNISTFKEFRLPSGNRIDFLDVKNAIIYELKPNNPRAIAAGQKQLDKYLQELQSLPQYQGIDWKKVLETY